MTNPGYGPPQGFGGPQDFGGPAQPGDQQFGHQQYPPQQYGTVGVPTVGSEDRTAAVLAHLSSLIAMVISAGWLSFVGPLVMWLIYKDRSPFVRTAAAGSFNFNLGMWLLSIVGWICFFTVVGIPLALVLWGVSFVAQIVCHAMGTAKALNGEQFRYPMQLKVLR